MSKLKYLLLFFGSLPLLATTRYVAQTAGTFSGGSACNGQTAITVSTFNGLSLSAGDVTYICGTLTASGGSSNFLNMSGSGTSGNLISLIFDTGAIITAPYWSGASITCGGGSYLLINGGTNGTIQATANGTGLANAADDGIGVNCSGSSNSEISNVTVSNIYVHTCTPPTSSCTDAGGQDTYGILWNGGNNVTIDHNTLSNAGKWAVFFAYQNNSGLLIYNNTISASDHGIVVGDASTNDVLSGSNCSNRVYYNDISSFQNWDENADDNHHDGVHTWANNAPGSKYYICVDDNYIHGNFGTTMNAGIFIESDEQSAVVFNNVINPSAGVYALGLVAVATGGGSGGTGVLVANNTLDSYGTTPSYANILLAQTTSPTMYNNVLPVAGYFVAAYTSLSGTITIDYDLYGSSGSNPFFGPSGCTSGASFSSWQSPCGYDVHGAQTTISLNSNFTPTSGSAVIGAGKNLTSLGITALDTSAPIYFGVSGSCSGGCVARPSSGAWDAGAYQYQSGASGGSSHTGKVTLSGNVTVQ